MPPQQQPKPVQRHEFNGQIHEFPADWSDAQIAAALASETKTDRTQAPPPQKRAGVLDLAKGLAGVVVDPLSAVSPQTKNTLMEGSIGAAKRTGQIAADVAQGPQAVVNRLQGAKPESARPELRPQGGAQTAGSFIPDLAISAATLGGASGPATGMQQGAARMWQNAARRPVMEPTTNALRVLDARLGHLNRANANAWGAMNPESTAARTFFDKGVQSTQQSPYSTLGAVLSSGNKARAAQALYDMGRLPAQQALGSGGMAVLQTLQRLLSGGQ